MVLLTSTDCIFGFSNQIFGLRSSSFSYMETYGILAYLHMQHGFPSDPQAENAIKPDTLKGKFFFVIHILLIHKRLQTKPIGFRISQHTCYRHCNQTPQHTYLVSEIHQICLTTVIIKLVNINTVQHNII